MGCEEAAVADGRSPSVSEQFNKNVSAWYMVSDKVCVCVCVCVAS